MPRRISMLVTVLILLSQLLAPAAPAQAAPPLTAGGPDEFGYTYDDTAPFSWISPNNNLWVDGDDVSSGPLDIGFPFPFYGVTYSQLYLSGNGVVNFGAPNSSKWNSQLPDPEIPNNLIAVYWRDLMPDGSRVHFDYGRGGAAPNRYFVAGFGGRIPNTVQTVSFEVILYENGNISVQHQASVPPLVNGQVTVGIESTFGETGLQYQSSGSAPRNVLFTYHAPTTARLSLGPVNSSRFVTPGSAADFPFTLYHTGGLGTDTFDFEMDSDCPFTLLWDSPGNPALADTDSDGKVDTGPLAQGAAARIITRFTPPAGGAVGDNYTAALSASSSRDPSVTRTVSIRMAVPSRLASVFGSVTDGSVDLLLNRAEGSSLSLPGPIRTFGHNPTVAELLNGNYWVAWDTLHNVQGNWMNWIEYAVLDHEGNILVPLTGMVNSPNTQFQHQDDSPSVAVAPDGTVGMVWHRRTRDAGTLTYNNDIWFATFNNKGGLVYGPVNLTLDPSWFFSEDVSIDTFFSSPTIAATTTNRFVIGWQSRTTGVNTIRYTVRFTSGGIQSIPATLPLVGSWGSNPEVNCLAGGKAIFTWTSGLGGPYYAVVQDNGVIVKSATRIPTSFPFLSTDAVQLPNGRVAVAWSSGEGVEYAVLDNAYTLAYGPTRSDSIEAQTDQNVISVIADEAGRVIMGWTNLVSGSHDLVYALGNDQAQFLTQPISYHTAADGFYPVTNSPGIAPYEQTLPLPGAFGKTAPANGSTGMSLRVTLSWGSDRRASTYQYCLDTVDDGVCSTAWSDPTLETSAQVSDLLNNTTYYWQVRAVNVGGTTYADGAESAGWSFTTTNVMPAPWYGSVTITSDRPVVAVGRPHIDKEVTSYVGFTSGSYYLGVPMLFKKAWGSYNSALYVQNVDPTHVAPINIRFLNTNGSLACSIDDTLQPLASKGWWLPAEDCLPDGWVGSAQVLASYPSQPIVAVARPHVGGEIMTYNGSPSFEQTSYLPMLFKNAFGGGYKSAFYIQNSGGGPYQMFDVEFFDSAGQLTCELKDEYIYQDHSRGFWLANIPCLPEGWVGGARITSDSWFAALARPHVGSQVTTYSGFSSGSTTSYLPMLFRKAFGGSYNSAFYVQNVDPAHTAAVSLKFYDSSGTLLCVMNESIAPLASKGWWTPDLPCLDDGWVGGVVVTSDYNIVALGRPHLGSQVTTYTGIPSGSTVQFLPMLFRYAWGTYNSAFYVQNTDETNPAHISMKFYDVDGNLSCTHSDTIPALATLGYWLPSMICEP